MIKTINDSLDVLHSKSTSINSKEELEQHISLFKEMKQLLKPKNYGSDNHNGLGLALPQMGINKRGFVFRKDDHYEIAINPKILKYGDRHKFYNEGCLSIPDEWWTVKRSYEINVVYRDINWVIKTEKLLYRDAEVFQHEFDHLDGILISDIGVKIEKKEVG
jgi:peptide deformylase